MPFTDTLWEWIELLGTAAILLAVALSVVILLGAIWAVATAPAKRRRAVQAEQRAVAMKRGTHPVYSGKE
jgi:protein-S-isoprenylcysteine O-methyltransferase Ste14